MSCLYQNVKERRHMEKEKNYKGWSNMVAMLCGGNIIESWDDEDFGWVWVKRVIDCMSNS